MVLSPLGSSIYPISSFICRRGIFPRGFYMTSSLSLPLLGYLQNQDSALQKTGAYSDSGAIKFLKRKSVVCREAVKKLGCR